MDKYGRNLNRMLKLNESDKYCWARLESIAAAHDGKRRLDAVDAEFLKEQAGWGDGCKASADENGSCWCGKFSSDQESGGK